MALDVAESCADGKENVVLSILYKFEIILKDKV